MGLKARKIKTMIEEYAEHCIQNFNSKLSTSFTFEIDWSCLPQNLDQWNWEDEALKQCFYNSYFFPLEAAFEEMFTDTMYHEAITEQINSIKIMGDDHGVACDYADQQFVYKHIMSVNQREQRLNEHFNRTAINRIKNTIDHQLN